MPGLLDTHIPTLTYIHICMCIYILYTYVRACINICTYNISTYHYEFTRKIQRKIITVLCVYICDKNTLTVLKLFWLRKQFLNFLRERIKRFVLLVIQKTRCTYFASKTLGHRLVF